jgi:glucose-6-phosphate 1-dehydrogenase
VPFFVRTGKRLAERDTRIVLTFRDAPLHLFHETGVRHVDSNRLVVHVQPDEGISVTFVAKVPGPEVEVQGVNMSFTYDSSFKSSPPEAYERLLHDALDGDHTLFIREDEVERGWAVVQPVLDSPPPVVGYRAGSWGPKEADALVSPMHWHNAHRGDAA